MTKRTKIAIIDYGSSNLQSVANALSTLGKDFAIVDNPKELSKFDKVIVPGVGAAGNAMEKLINTGFAKVLPELKVPTLGICLGLQLMALIMMLTLTLIFNYRNNLFHNLLS